VTSRLADLQVWFHAAVTGGAARADAACAVAGSPALPAAEGVGVYADMWIVRQVAALREDFPALASLLGDERFDGMAAEYLASFPSDHFDLGRLGRRLSRHLRATGRDRPDAADLAALEWARLAAFFEADAEGIGRGALLALPPARFAAATLRVVPALRALRLRHDVCEVWGALVRGEPPPPPAPRPAHVAVWRQGFEVFHAAIPPDEARALAMARRGAPLAAVLAEFEARPDPSSAALSALESWFAEGWIAAVGPLPPAIPGG
jgi:hypothetical protein